MGLLSPCPPVSTSNGGARMVARTPYQMDWEVSASEEARPGDRDRCLNHRLGGIPQGGQDRGALHGPTKKQKHINCLKLL